MAAMKLGSLVRFRAGRGFSQGRVRNIADTIATIETDAGKYVNRQIAKLEWMSEMEPEAQPSPLPEPCSQAQVSQP